MKSDLDYISDSKDAILFDKAPMTRWVIYLIFIIIACGIVWAYYARLDEVTVAQGTVIPSAKVKIVQNLEGGIVRRIDVKEGELVKKGQALLQLDDTQFSAEYQQNLAKYRALLAAQLRLQAEAAGDTTLDYPARFVAENKLLAQHQRELFKENRKALSEKMATFQERLRLAERELKIITPLVKEKLMSQLDLIKTQREVSDIRGKMMAQKTAYRQDALSEFNKNEGAVTALKEALIAAKDRVTRTTVVAPIAGHVNNLKIHTVGGVMQPGMQIMEIVPVNNQLIVEAKVMPSDIAFIKPGQKAIIKFSAYDYSIYGGLKASVLSVSPNTITEQNGDTHFELKLATDKAYIESNGRRLPIRSGMTATADIITGKKSVLDYLLKPLLKTKQGALRER